MATGREGRRLRISARAPRGPCGAAALPRPGPARGPGLPRGSRLFNSRAAVVASPAIDADGAVKVGARIACYWMATAARCAAGHLKKQISSFIIEPTPPSPPCIISAFPATQTTAQAAGPAAPAQSKARSTASGRPQRPRRWTRSCACSTAPRRSTQPFAAPAPFPTLVLIRQACSAPPPLAHLPSAPAAFATTWTATPGLWG